MRRLIAIAMLTAPASMWAQTAAGPACTGGGQTYVLPLPTSISVLPTLSIGTPLTGWVDSPVVNNGYTCTTAADARTGIGSRLLHPSDTGLRIQSGGITYQVHHTGLAGVGMAVRRDVRIGATTYMGWKDAEIVGNVPPWDVNAATSADGVQTSGARLGVMLVKTGAIASGELPAASVAEAAAFIDDVAQSNPPRIAFGTSATAFSALTCTTPDVVIDLGTHESRRFTGPGSTTPAKAFGFALNHCPAGLKGITYQIDARTAIVDAGNAVVALNAASAATGVGVQLLDGYGNPTPLGTAIEVPGYASGNGGSYTIPLKARYYQTGNIVGGGSANTEMTVTLNYQ